MCGRARLSTDFSQIKIAFRIPPERPTPNFAPTYNLAPTDPIPIIRYDSEAGERVLDVARWWLVPWFRQRGIEPLTRSLAGRFGTENGGRSYCGQGSFPIGQLGNGIQRILSVD